jgi:hypothetical protein
MPDSQNLLPECGCCDGTMMMKASAAQQSTIVM